MGERNYIQPIVAEAVHIDTVRLSHAYRASDLPSPERLIKELGFIVNTNQLRDNIVHTAHSKAFGSKISEPHLTVIQSENRYKYSGINIECSLAKLESGTGTGKQHDEDIGCALDAIEDFIRGRIGVEFDAQTAKVRRYDVNADFPVGEERIPLYLETLSRPHARLLHSRVGHTTNYFTNRQRGFVAYGKMAEMQKQFKEGKVTREDVLAAEGIIRIEKRLYQSQAVNRFANSLRVINEARQLLTKAVATKFISDAIAELNLDKPKFSADAKSELLIERFGKRATEMMGVLTYREILGEDFWVRLGWGSQTYDRRKKDLKKHNLWDISPAEALPALLVLPDDADNNSTSLS